MAVSSISSRSGTFSSSQRSLAMSECIESRWLLTDTYSPSPIDNAPATSAAIPAVSTTVLDESAAATPRISAAVDTMPSLAPITEARSQPERWL